MYIIFTVSIESTLEAFNQTEYISSLAQLLQIEESRISLTIVSGSIIVTVNVKYPNVTLAEQGSSTLTSLSPARLSLELGVTINTVDSITVTETPYQVPPPPPPKRLRSILARTIVMLFLAAAVIWNAWKVLLHFVEIEVQEESPTSVTVVDDFQQPSRRAAPWAMPATDNELRV